MPKGCGRHFCPGCGEELIHRDHRRAWESASAFGQIVWRCGPRLLTTGDIDHYACVFNNGGPSLLRIIEHKQPDQPLKDMQARVLELLGRVIEHAIACEKFALLDPRSGVFLLRGDITAEQTGRRRTFFAGRTSVERVEGGRFVTKGELRDAEHIFRFLEGSLKKAAAGPRRNQPLPQPELLGWKAA